MELRDRFYQESLTKQNHKVNPIHSYLHKQYRNELRVINELHHKIIKYKLYISKGYRISCEAKEALIKTREKLKYHSSIAKYLKQEIRYQNYRYNYQFF